MQDSDSHATSSRPWFFLLPALLLVAAIVTVRDNRASTTEPVAGATYSHGVLDVTIPYHAPHSGAGHLVMEVLDPEDQVLGRAEQSLDVADGNGHWRERIPLARPLAVDDLVWHRVRYRFEYSGGETTKIEGTESISQILRTPVIHILGQQSYLAGGEAAVRVIVTDSQDAVIGGRGSVRIELLAPNEKSHTLFNGPLNRRGTTEAQFRLPAGLVGSYDLRYRVDTAIGSAEFTQSVRLEDKVSILLTTEKPLYQPGQTIHVRALSLDRSNHEATANRKLTFELEDSRGNKVFRKATQTDKFGVSSAEFALADEVNLGTYHLRALMGDSEAPTNTAEIALNVERYVLPKFKVAVDFAGANNKTKRGYRPGDHVTGTVRANYFFGKPVDDAAITVKASSMDVAVFEAASAQGKTDHDGVYHFDLKLPTYFAGRPLSQGAARVLIEATVKDSAAHSETRGEPIIVSELPLLITAVPEGGTLAPNLENQVFILTSYPDGTPASTRLKVHAEGTPDQEVNSDSGGVAVVRISPGSGVENIKIEAQDREGNHASNTIELQSRHGEDQILLRTERAVYRAGDRINLRVFSTRKRGAAYVDIVKDGQTVLTRDLDLENGQAELTLTATPDLAGTVDFNAYIFSSNAQAVGDHRLIFVQPADELKIDAVADASVYKPGDEARIRFHVTNSKGEGVSAALGLQVVDEAVFALAEKQPGFAKVFFYLEQEVMKPRYEIHSIGLPEVVEPAEESKTEQRDRAARALFSATEIVTENRFETEFGRTVPMTKYQEYSARYRAHFQKQVNELAEALSKTYANDQKMGNPTQIHAKILQACGAECRDSWGHSLTFEPANWDSTKTYYMVKSAGPDGQINTGDDLQEYLLFRGRNAISRSSSQTSAMAVTLEHDRGPFNGLAEIAGTVTDPTGAVVPQASVEVRKTPGGKIRLASTDAAGRFSVPGLPIGKYVVQVTARGFKMARQELTLRQRDRAVLAATLSVGQSSELVEVMGASPVIETEMAIVAVLRPAYAMAGVAGGGRQCSTDRWPRRHANGGTKGARCGQRDSCQRRLRITNCACAFLLPRSSLHQS